MKKVVVLRPFNERPDGGLVSPGDTITVDEVRRGELIRLGLVKDAEALAEKAAPPLVNKMAPAPENKAATPSPETLMKRGPGRPSKAK